MSAANVLKMIKDQDIQFVDFRFTDTKGKEQHVSVPAAMADEDMFDEGKMFDGSSIAGWKGIQESDMILLPDANSAVIDPSLQDTTLLLRCDVIEPTTMQGYDRDPRTIAKRGEAYLKSTGIGTQRTLVQKRSSSFSILSVGLMTSAEPRTKLNRKKRPGVPIVIMRKAILGTALA